MCQRGTSILNIRTLGDAPYVLYLLMLWSNTTANKTLAHSGYATLASDVARPSKSQKGILDCHTFQLPISSRSGNWQHLRTSGYMGGS